MKKIYLLMAILMAGWIIPVRAKTPDREACIKNRWGTPFQL